MRTAFLFPGQGAQYVGMGKDFADTFVIARQTFEEADDLLGRKLSQIAFFGPEAELTETKNSQLAIYVMSTALLRVLQKEYGLSAPDFCAGLSLGEYTALMAAGRLSFADGLRLVGKRAEFMNLACEKNPGTMAVVLGLDDQSVEECIQNANLPNDLWIANYNCPGQVVLSGTARGVAAGSAAAQKAGAKRVLLLQVHGAFHSPLMAPAQEMLAPCIDEAPFIETAVPIAMNVEGALVAQTAQIRENLKKQVTGSVRWHQGIHALEEKEIGRYLEVGCGKTLSGLNRKMQVRVPTLSVEKVEDLRNFESQWGKQE